MSATTSGVFDNGVYKAHTAALRTSNTTSGNDRLFSPKGRIGVLTFNARNLVCMLAILTLLVPLLTAAFGLRVDSPSMLAIVVTVICSLLILIPLYLMAVSGVKRLHDLNYSGWWVFVTVLPVVGLIWTLFISLKQANVDSVNKYGGSRIPSSFDLIVGRVGIVAMVALTLAVVTMPIMILLEYI